MGFVVAATHLRLEQKVALKFLRNESMDNPEVVERFLREARASVRLRGEHVARVHDVGVHDDGRPFMVMELLEGADLSRTVKVRGPLSVEETVDYMLQVCEALAEAHALGIVHRDLKPANLFLTRTPAGLPLIKVLDFGISKANPLGDAGTSAPSITSSASMLGSPGYMAPEQMRSSRDVDARSDIWSMGIILFRLVSGHVPFHGDTLGDLLHKVMSEPTPSLRTHCPNLPAGFEQVVEKCLMKQRIDRYANLAELASALVPFAGIDSARLSAHRVAMVLSGAGVSRPSLPSGTPAVPAVSANQVTTNGTGTTRAAWTGTGSDKRRLTKLSAGIAVTAMVATLGAVGAVIGAFVVRGRGVSAASATADVASTMETAVVTGASAASASSHAKSLPSGEGAVTAVAQPVIQPSAAPPEAGRGAASASAAPRPSVKARPKAKASASAMESVVAPDIPSTRE